MRSIGLMQRIYTRMIEPGLKIEVIPEDHIQQQLFWYGVYEAEAVTTWQQLCKADSVVLDIGANIGYYSLLAAAIAKQGKVYAFEPIPSLQQRIRRNMVLNRFQNIHLVPAAASDRDGKVKMHVAAADNIGMSGLRPQENFSGETIEVNAIRIDDWAVKYNIGKIDLVKIDTEGAEWLVLQGMVETLKRYRPAVIIEVMDELLRLFDRSAKDIYGYFEELNYEAFEMLADGSTRRINEIKEAYTILFLPRK